MKLLGLILGSLFVVVVSLASFHFWGLGQTYTPYNNKFVQAERPWIVVPWEQQYFSEKIPDMILYASVYSTDESLLLVRPSAEVAVRGNKSEQKPSPTRPILQDFLKLYANNRILLSLEDNISNIDLLVAKALSEEAKTERIMIQSDFNVVLESIRKQLPYLVFGSTMADVMRLKTFDSIGIITATPFKGDVYFTNLKIRNKNALTEAITKELKRRKIPIIVGPVDNIDEAQSALSLGADGLFVKKPEWLLQWMNQELSHKTQ